MLVRFDLSFLLSLFRVLHFHEASEGLAPFRSRNAWTPFPPDLAAASLIAKKGTLHGPKARGSGEKDRPIDPMSARIRPLENEPEPVFEPMTSGRAPALHACECLTIPAFKSYPFNSPTRGECGRFLSGARERLSSSERSPSRKPKFLLARRLMILRKNGRRRSDVWLTIEVAAHSLTRRAHDPGPTRSRRRIRLGRLR